MAFDYIPGNDYFHRLDPRAKLLFWVVWLFLIAAFTDPLLLILMFLFVLAVCRHAKIPLNRFKNIVKGMIWVAVGYGFFIAISPNLSFESFKNLHLLFNIQVWRTFPIYLESVVMMFAMVMKVLNMVFVLNIITMLTPIRDLIVGFSKLKAPTILSLVTSLAFGYIPVLADETEKIMEALSSRGLKIRSKNPVTLAKSLMGKIMIPSILNAFRRATFLAVALELRGYSHDIAHRTSRSQLKLETEDWLGFAFIGLLAVIGILSLPFIIGFGRAGYLSLPLVLRILDFLGISLPTVQG